MEPTTFKQSNKTLQRPDDMTDEECGELPIYTNGVECFSKWRLTWRERLHCLIHGTVWLGICSGETQPPVMLWATDTVFQYQHKDNL